MLTDDGERLTLLGMNDGLVDSVFANVDSNLLDDEGSSSPNLIDSSLCFGVLNVLANVTTLSEYSVYSVS